MTHGKLVTTRGVLTLIRRDVGIMRPHVLLDHSGNSCLPCGLVIFWFQILYRPRSSAVQLEDGLTLDPPEVLHPRVSPAI